MSFVHAFYSFIIDTFVPVVNGICSEKWKMEWASDTRRCCKVAQYMTTSHDNLTPVMTASWFVSVTSSSHEWQWLSLHHDSRSWYTYSTHTTFLSIAIHENVRLCFVIFCVCVYLGAKTGRNCVCLCSVFWVSTLAHKQKAEHILVTAEFITRSRAPRNQGWCQVKTL